MGPTWALKTPGRIHRSRVESKERGEHEAAVRDLAVGDRLITSDGTVSVLDIRAQSSVVQVFNLKVDRVHSYTIGETEVLVHNKFGPGAPLTFGEPLTRAAKKSLHGKARRIWEKTMKYNAATFDEHIHHRVPLEYAHLFTADPNRTSNLFAMPSADHDAVSGAWTTWRASLGGVAPTPSQVEAQAAAIDFVSGQYMKGIE